MAFTFSYACHNCPHAGTVRTTPATLESINERVDRIAFYCHAGTVRTTPATPESINERVDRIAFYCGNCGVSMFKYIYDLNTEHPTAGGTNEPMRANVRPLLPNMNPVVVDETMIDDIPEELL